MNARIPPIETLERELKAARQELRNLQVIQMKPGHSAEKLEVLRQLEKSCRAEVRLRRSVLEKARAREGS